MSTQPKQFHSIPGPEDISRVVMPNGIVILCRSNFNSSSVVVSGYITVNPEGGATYCESHSTSTALDYIKQREQFGKKYQIAFDECYDPKGRPRATLDPWYMRIPCKIGHINPYGGEKLELFIDGHRKIRAKIKRSVKIFERICIISQGNSAKAHIKLNIIFVGQ